MDQQQKSAGETILGGDTTVVGKIESRGALRIDGRVEGEVVAKDSVVVGPSGVVKADVSAASVTINGQVDGNVIASKKLELQPTAVVKGDLQTVVGALTIQAGARIDGRCTMSNDKPAAAPAQPAAAASAPAAAQGGAPKPPQPQQTPKR